MRKQVPHPPVVTASARYADGASAQHLLFAISDKHHLSQLPPGLPASNIGPPGRTGTLPFKPASRGLFLVWRRQCVQERTSRPWR